MNQDQYTLHIFRHGETDWNVTERFQGQIDVPLNDNGRSQARALIPYFRKNPIEAILSSDLIRALETAQIVASGLDVQITQDLRLREAHMGEAQGLTRHEMEARFGESMLCRWRSSHLTDADVCYPGGETGNQILARSTQAIREFFERSKIKSVGIATHGGVIRRLIHSLLPPDAAPIPIPNGVVYPLQYHSKHGFSVDPTLFIID